MPRLEPRKTLGTSVLFRADSGPGIGAGHVMRCLALAQYLHDAGIRCNLLTKSGGGDAIERWRHEGFPVQVMEETDAEHDGAMTADSAGRLGASWVIADGYGFLLPFQEAIKREGLHLLCFDDLADCPTVADIVVNPNMGSELRARYECPRQTELLLGSSYAMLRREFLRAAPGHRQEPPQVLVTFGGDDRESMALAALTSLESIARSFTATIICNGSSDPDSSRSYGGRNGVRCRVIGSVPNMALLMAEADVGVCAGGTTALESAYMGLPMVLITLAANQVPGAETLVERGCAVLAGHGRESLPQACRYVTDLLSDDSRRREMSRIGRSLVDGRGPERVASRIQ